MARRSRDQALEDVATSVRAVAAPIVQRRATLPVPDQVALRAEHSADGQRTILSIEWGTATHPVEVEPAKVLARFLRLPDADDPEAYLEFTKQYGPLPADCVSPRTDGTWSALRRGGLYGWECTRRHFMAILHAAERLKQGRPAQTLNVVSRGAVLCRHLPPDPDDFGRSTGAGGEPPPTLTGLRSAIAECVNQMLRTAYLVPTVAWVDCAPRLELAPSDDAWTGEWLVREFGDRTLDLASAARFARAAAECNDKLAPISTPLPLPGFAVSPLYSLLCGQLVSVVCASEGAYLCAYCRLPYGPAVDSADADLRRPKAGTRPVCRDPDCKRENRKERCREHYLRKRTLKRAAAGPHATNLSAEEGLEPVGSRE